MRNCKCLMIETPDNRKFFTQEKNYDRLIEYANTFAAKISVVVAEKVDLLDLPELAEAISTPPRKLEEPTNVELLETKIDQDAPKKKRRNLAKHADEVQKYIRQQFLANKTIGLKELAEDFKNKELYPAFFFKHIAKVKSDLEKEGFKINKIGAGKYRIAYKNKWGDYACDLGNEYD